MIKKNKEQYNTDNVVVLFFLFVFLFLLGIAISLMILLYSFYSMDNKISVNNIEDILNKNSILACYNKSAKKYFYISKYNKQKFYIDKNSGLILYLNKKYVFSIDNCKVINKVNEKKLRFFTNDN